MNYLQFGAHKFEEQVENMECKNSMLKIKRKHQLQGALELSANGGIIVELTVSSYNLLKFSQKFCPVKPKIPLGKSIKREHSSPKGMSMAVTTAPRVFCTASPTFLAISVPPSSSEGSSATSA